MHSDAKRVAECTNPYTTSQTMIELYGSFV